MIFEWYYKILIAMIIIGMMYEVFDYLDDLVKSKTTVKKVLDKDSKQQ